MTRLGDSVARAQRLLTSNLASSAVVEQLLAETTARRTMDLSDLDPHEQAALVSGRSVDVLPSAEDLHETIESARAQGQPLTVKLGIDPTSSDVHLGHAVPVIILSRFQRMGHHVVLIIGDITAKIGDPSGRSTDRPTLTDEEIASNLASYQSQLSPFFDFDQADFRHNSEWLTEVRLPELIKVLAQIPVSMSLQREDFRARLASGQGLAMSEFMYSVVMAIDSVKIGADIELGGVDQLLNMQMGRKVMEIAGQNPQLVVAMPLIEGTDGTGRKMSKSAGNYIALSATADDIFGKVMSIPDRLMVPYLRAWTEWVDTEIDTVIDRMEKKSLHPMDLKKILAGEAVSALHDVRTAMQVREQFSAQFSRRSFAEVDSLPAVDITSDPFATLGSILVHRLGFTPSVSAARRIARQNGLRVVVESDQGQESVVLPEEAIARPLHVIMAEEIITPLDAGSAGPTGIYLKVGRKVARLHGVYSR